jgi:hypothetical protein
MVTGQDDEARRQALDEQPRRIKADRARRRCQIMSGHSLRNAVEATAVRLEARPQPGFSGGVLEWRVG